MNYRFVRRYLDYSIKAIAIAISYKWSKTSRREIVLLTKNFQTS